MKIILTNGKELNPLLVTGAQSYVQGANRDTLTFIFSAEESMDELDAAFSPSACESITVEDKYENVYIYKAYTIRAKLEKSPVVVVPSTPETEEVKENRITVSMAQRTYAETQLTSLTETVDVLVLESLMA
jgi:hypothetical protein